MAYCKNCGNKLDNGAKFCPKCGNSAPKDDEWKFSVNWKTGAFGCLRGSCGYHGHFVELCRDFGYKIGLEAEQQYVQFPQPQGRIKPRESAIAYLSGRGISRESNPAAAPAPEQPTRNSRAAAGRKGRMP